MSPRIQEIIKRLEHEFSIKPERRETPIAWRYAAAFDDGNRIWIKWGGFLPLIGNSKQRRGQRRKYLKVLNAHFGPEWEMRQLIGAI